MQVPLKFQDFTEEEIAWINDNGPSLLVDSFKETVDKEIIDDLLKRIRSAMPKNVARDLISVNPVRNPYE